MPEAVFDTVREQVSVCAVGSEGIPYPSNAHVFAVCVTADGVPVVGVRRTSFAYQAITAQRKKAHVTPVKRSLLQHMYFNEVKEICTRLVNSEAREQLAAFRGRKFEELVMLGGSPTKHETARECLVREVGEESDYRLSVVNVGASVLKIAIYDKILDKKYTGYCMLCFVAETLRDIEDVPLYNIEVRSICSLEKKKGNEKYPYLAYIYNTLTPTK